MDYLFIGLKVNEVKLSNATSRLIEEQYYEAVVDELQQGIKRSGLWAKALAKSNGDEGKAKALYISYRVQSIKDEMKLSDAMREQEIKAEKLRKQAKIERRKQVEAERAIKEEEAKKKQEIKEQIEIDSSISNLHERGYTVIKKGYGWFVSDYSTGSGIKISSAEQLHKYVKECREKGIEEL